MTNLRVRQITRKVRELFEADLDQYGLNPNDPNIEEKILSRCLAATGIYLSTGCDPKSAAAAVWDGRGDNGIDAAFYHADERQVLLVQSKWIKSGSGEPSSGEVGLFTCGVKDLIENDLDSFDARLHERISEICDALNEPGTTVRLIIISTGKSELAEHATNKLKKLTNEFNSGDDQGIVSFEVLGLSDVSVGLTSGSNSGKIKLAATLLDWSSISNPYWAYFGIIDGSQLKKWWSAYGARIVEKNIRSALGETDVNLQIGKTASEHPQDFWYFHNGITLIADEALMAPGGSTSRSSGNFEFKGVSIVNGAQTVSTLAKINDDEALGNVKVSIRIIILKDAPSSFGKDVTRTNNSQNRVEGRDFVSSDSEQDRIRREMEVEDIKYQVARSDDFSANEKSCDLIEVTTALACANSDNSLSVAAKTGIGRFYGDLSKAPYKTIFNAQTSGAQAFNAVRLANNRKLDF